ncbi:hypothetical protein V6N12_028021 [Hibiscus sabdariffa]|uniref:BI1-like protein n=1 Tax=Hibiscus sabdariffa TaxID=183260 RepID=A0ABR2F4M2_9ROSI
MMHGYERISSTDASKGGKFDLESGETLYPGLSYGENELRWAFVRKVYGILAAQLLLTTMIFAIAVLSPPINDLLRGNSGILVFLSLVPLICIFLSDFFLINDHYGVALAYLANTDGRIVLEALILTAVVVSSLTGYTFAYDYLGLIFFTSLIILVLTSLIQERSLGLGLELEMFFPLGPTTTAVYGAISALIFCGFIVYDTDYLIKRFTYDDYILASATLYLDILNLFVSVMRVLRSGDN